MEKKLAVYIDLADGLGGVLNIEALSKAATKEKKVPICRTHERLFSAEGRAMIRKDIDEEGVNAIIIVGPSPRVLQEYLQFPGCIVERVNLREQVIWAVEPDSSLKNPNEDIQMMAEDYLRMGIVKVQKMTLPEPYQAEEPFSKDIMVVGGGITGLTAALEASKAGYKVHIVEKKDTLGGFQKHVKKRISFPYQAPADNITADMIRAATSDPNITVHTSCTVAQTTGGPGLFGVTLTNDAQFRVGAIVEAPGWEPYDPKKLPEKLGYGKSPRVITNTEFERADFGSRKIASAAFLQCAGSRDPEHLAYCSSACCLASLKQAVQLKQNNPDANVYIFFKEMRTPGQAEDFYRAAQDAGVTFIRCQDPEVKTTMTGDVSVEGFDEVLGEDVATSRLELVVLATGMVPVTGFGENVKAKLAEQQKAQVKSADALPVPLDVIYASNVLNLAYRQGPELPDLAYGFQDSHFICFPFESRRTGIHPAGCVRKPMDSAQAFEDATGAAMKAVQAVELTALGQAVHPRVGDMSYPEINFQRCTQCRRCTDECPFGAYNEDEKGNPQPVPTRCRRCGVCMGACPERIISFKNYSVDMIGSMIKEVEIPEEDEEKPRVLILACENDAYPALDMCGLKRLKYSPYVRVVSLRCLGSINLVWIADALSKGFDGVLLFGCRHGDNYQCHFIRGSELANIRMSKISETLTRLALEPERIRVEELAITDWPRIPEIISEFMETMEKVGPNPFKDL